MRNKIEKLGRHWDIPCLYSVLGTGVQNVGTIAHAAAPHVRLTSYYKDEQVQSMLQRQNKSSFYDRNAVLRSLEFRLNMVARAMARPG
jgi:hypothetical protein